MPAYNGKTKQPPMGFSVWHFTFPGVRFIIVSLVLLAVAMTIGSFSIVAVPGDSLARILISSQCITIIVLVAWAWFVRTGFKHSPLHGKLRLIDICLMAFIAGQIARLLSPLVGF